MDSGDNDDMVRLLSHSYSPPAEQQVTMPSDVISPRSSRIKRGSSGALGSAFDPTTVHAAASFQPPQDQTVGLRKPGSGTSFHQRFPSVALFDLEEPPVPPQHQTGTLTKNSSTKPSPEKKLLRQTSGGQLTSLTRLGLPEDVDILGPSPTTHQAFPSMLRDAQGTTTSHSETLHESPGRVSELGTESPSLPPLNKKKTAAGATRLDGIPSAHRQVFPPPLGIDFNLWLQSMQQWSHRPGGDPEPDLPWDAEDPEAPDQRFLFYSDASGLLQANHFESLDFSVLPGSPSETLSKTPYWLDVNFPTNSEMNLLSRVSIFPGHCLNFIYLTHSGHASTDLWHSPTHNRRHSNSRHAGKM